MSNSNNALLQSEIMGNDVSIHPKGGNSVTGHKNKDSNKSSKASKHETSGMTTPSAAATVEGVLNFIDQLSYCDGRYFHINYFV